MPKYNNHVQQGASEASPPACNIILLPRVHVQGGKVISRIVVIVVVIIMSTKIALYISRPRHLNDSSAQ